MQVGAASDNADLVFLQAHFSCNGDGVSGNAHGVIWSGRGIPREIIKFRQVALLRLAA